MKKCLLRKARRLNTYDLDLSSSDEKYFPSPRPHSSDTPLPGERGGGEGSNYISKDLKSYFILL